MDEYRWSPQQSAALGQVSDWLNDPSGSQVFTLFGFAGTGKTTLAKYLASEVDGLALFGAYTGKAASVLRKMGCPGASTLHSLLYSVSEGDKTKLVELELEYAAVQDQDPEDDRLIELAEEIEFLREKLRQPVFTLQPESVIAGAKLVVVDECSMINRQLAQDLESFGVKLLIMGDPAQLPPVEGGGYYTKRTPDVMLTEIHRQAADSPIIRWATKVRSGEHLPYGADGEGSVSFCTKVHKDSFPLSELIDGSQLLAGKNVTRRKLNSAARKKLGHTGAYPNKGERLVVLKNDRDWGVMNGVTCEAAEDAVDADEQSLSLDLTYEDRCIPQVPVNRKWFDAYNTGDDPKHDWDDRWMLPMDFGYCLTVHKAQGSQWDAVTVCDDGFGHWDRTLRQRWLYTAITRASQRLRIVG